jgi:tetratricopeptide (TPR) repeat protein
VPRLAGARRGRRKQLELVMKAMIARIAVLLLVFASPVAATDMQTYLRDTNALVERGDYPAALERYIWFHNHALDHEPAGMYGVRLSFALSSWKSLGDVYPPALEALVAMRDTKTRTVLEKPGDFGLFHDVVSLNRTLEQDDQSIQLFEAVQSTAPEYAEKCWQVVKDAVIAAKRFDIAREYLRNPLKEFDRIHGMYILTTSLSDKIGMEREEFAKYNNDHFVEQCLQLIETAIAIDDLESAKAIQAKALTVLADERLKAAIPAGND